MLKVKMKNKIKCMYAFCTKVNVLCMKSNCFETHESAVSFATPKFKPGTLRIKECKLRKERKEHALTWCREKINAATTQNHLLFITPVHRCVCVFFVVGFYPRAVLLFIVCCFIFVRRFINVSASECMFKNT